MKHIIKSTVCIVGSGFCGYAAYLKFMKQKINVILIEGGEFNTPKTVNEQPEYYVNENKYHGSLAGKQQENWLLTSHHSRKYTLGGSSMCWAGWIKPLEESTYQNYYSSFPDQSWGELRLRNYEKQSLNLLNSPILDFDPYLVANSLKMDLPALPEGLSYSTYSYASEPLRLKDFWKTRATSSPEKINTKKNVLFGYRLIRAIKDNGEIQKFLFQSRDGRQLIVEANQFLLCLGGIENGRFIKNLNEEDKKGSSLNKKIGNLQEHPHYLTFASFNRTEKNLPDILTREIEVKQSSKIFKRPGTVKITISAWDGPGTPKVAFEVAQYWPRPSDNSYFQTFKDYIKPYFGRPKYGDFIVKARCEQTPNKSSRIEYGKDKTLLNWNVIESDFKYYSKYLKRLASFLIVNKYAKNFRLVEPSVSGYAFPKIAKGFGHHIGTVPYLNGILDKNFRYSRFKNLYVVGASSFPLGGFENPTQSAIATALTAADNIIASSS